MRLNGGASIRRLPTTTFLENMLDPGATAVFQADQRGYGPTMPHQPVPSKSRRFARSMRHEPTEAEDKLWHELRDRRLDRIKFRRQMPVGGYIVDFVCLDAKLVVEIDGSQHADSGYDAARKAALQARGFRVLRFWNDDVLREMNSVCDTIIAYVRDQSLQPWR